jgi:septal ring factor EnvC (AmiA/AmiB activator)
MKKIYTSLCCILFLVLMGCTQDTSTENITITDQLETMSKEIELLNEKLLQYDSELDNKEQAIKELQEQMQIQNSDYNMRINEIYNSTHLNGHLIKHLPSITHKQGFIKEIIDTENENSFLVDFAKWEQSEDAPNGAILVNEKEEIEKIQLNKDITTYIIENAILAYQPFEDFKEGKHSGLYNLYFIENEVVLVTEQLLP